MQAVFLYSGMIVQLYGQMLHIQQKSIVEDLCGSDILFCDAPVFGHIKGWSLYYCYIVYIILVFRAYCWISRHRAEATECTRCLPQSAVDFFF